MVRGGLEAPVGQLEQRAPFDGEELQEGFGGADLLGHQPQVGIATVQPEPPAGVLVDKHHPPARLGDDDAVMSRGQIERDDGGVGQRVFVALAPGNARAGPQQEQRAQPRDEEYQSNGYQ